MTEFFDRYYPTVSLRRGEMRAFEKLPASEKQKMLPIVLLAPWLNSISFDNSYNIIAKSIGDQPIIVDLDRYYSSSSDLESRRYFWSLLDAEKGPTNWKFLVENHKNYIPCIQILNVDSDKIDEQIRWSRDLARGFCLRFELERWPNSDLDFGTIEKVADDDCLIIIDYGYSDYTEILHEKTSAILTTLFEISPEFRVVICGSNFPNDFAEFDEFSKSQPNSARQLFSTLKGQFGNYNMFYGDWASTKPRKYDGHGSPPLPRIDYPTASQWIMARSKALAWSFQDAATRITRLPEWESHPKIWGTGMIEKTSLGLPGGIKTHPEVIAARINIHLYVQANFNLPNPPNQPKGKWKDPI
jgi:hypothetical protein